jgi:hypothetical protein
MNNGAIYSIAICRGVKFALFQRTMNPDIDQITTGGFGKSYSARNFALASATIDL